jgi:hypothetical protein
MEEDGEGEAKRDGRTMTLLWWKLKKCQRIVQ